MFSSPSILASCSFCLLLDKPFEYLEELLRYQQELEKLEVTVTHNLMCSPWRWLLTKEILGGMCTICRNHIMRKKKDFYKMWVKIYVTAFAKVIF